MKVVVVGQRVRVVPSVAPVMDHRSVYLQIVRVDQQALLIALTQLIPIGLVKKLVVGLFDVFHLCTSICMSGSVHHKKQHLD